MEYYLAQVNIGKMLGPIDSIVMADFVANLDSVNALAENSPGFVWRLKEDSGNATSIKVYDDDLIIVNMSVWEDIDALFRFVYQSNHVEVFKRRKEWFERLPQMHMVLWYIPSTHRPTVEEAIEKLNYLRKHGESPAAFTFKRKFTVEEALG